MSDKNSQPTFFVLVIGASVLSFVAAASFLELRQSYLNFHQFAYGRPPLLDISLWLGICAEGASLILWIKAMKTRVGEEESPWKGALLAFFAANLISFSVAIPLKILIGSLAV